MTSIGETIRHDDSVIDLGAVADEGLFGLREEIEKRLATPGFYTWSHHREEDAEYVELIDLEIYWRFRAGISLDEDEEGAYRCGIGCCQD